MEERHQLYIQELKKMVVYNKTVRKREDEEPVHDSKEFLKAEQKSRVTLQVKTQENNENITA